MLAVIVVMVVVGVPVIAILMIVLRLVRKKKEAKSAYEAKLKDQVLSEALKNSLGKGGSFREQERVRSLEAISQPVVKQAVAGEGKVVVKLVVTGKQSASYVVNPEEDILIGSQEGMNKIVLADSGIARQHCDIFAYKGGVYIRNLNHSYETILKRKNRSTNVSEKGIQVYTGDMIQIGVCKIQVTLMDYVGKVIQE